MSVPMRRATANVMLRYQRPALTVGASHLRYLLGGGNAAAAGSVIVLPKRNIHALSSTMPATSVMNHTTFFGAHPEYLPPRFAQEHVITGTSQAAANQQIRYKSALFDHHEQDDLVPGGFDAEFAQKAFEANRKVWDNMVKSSEEVLHGHIHDKTTHKVSILDVASGPGEPAATLAKKFPEATVYSTDINPDMVKAADARMKSLGINNGKCVKADMENLENFEDATFDLVTCSYGLMFCQDPDLALYEIHRVLKPGGTLITAVWDNLTTERASNTLLTAACGNKMPPHRLIDPMSLAKPRLLENLIERSGMSLVKVDHGEYPFKLTEKGGEPSDFAFRFVSMPIYPNLVELVETGESPNAFEAAKRAFDGVVVKEDWIIKSNDGVMMTKPNRYKMAIARRKYEDDDGKRKIVRRSKQQLNLYPRSRQTRSSSPEEASQAFDEVLADTYSRVNNGPWQEMVTSVDHILGARDMTKVRILDLASGPGEPAISLAKRFPRASVVASDISPSMMENAKKKIQEQSVRNMRAIVADAQDLSSFQTGSFDIVTCSFGLSHFPNPEKAMQEIHRVLKPGGSLVAAVWDSISIEHISDEIMKDVMNAQPSPPRVIDHLSFSRPHALEQLVEGNNMALVRVDHEEFPFQLSGLVHQPDDFAFNVVTIPIHPNLIDLENSGENPNAFQVAHESFKRIIKDGKLVHVDREGRMWTGPNRFKMVVARRQFEDSDK